MRASMIMQRGVPEPETRVGHCCGCKPDEALSDKPLYKIPGLFRYRCADCFEKETGYRHPGSPLKSNIILV
jgi:hypothetical protein